MFHLSSKKTGMSLIEVVIASAIVLSLSLVLISVNVAYYKSSSTSLKEIKGIYLIEEGIEVINFMKKSDWTSIGETGTDYYLIKNNSLWSATTTKNYIDEIFERKFSTETVNRDDEANIVLAGGVLDPNTRKLTVQVSWNDSSGTTTKSISSYIMKSND